MRAALASLLLLALAAPGASAQGFEFRQGGLLGRRTEVRVGPGYGGYGYGFAPAYYGWPGYYGYPGYGYGFAPPVYSYPWAGYPWYGGYGYPWGPPWWAYR